MIINNQTPNRSDPYSSQALMRPSAASSNAGLRGTLRKCTEPYVHRQFNLRCWRSAVWGTERKMKGRRPPATQAAVNLPMLFEVL